MNTRTCAGNPPLQAPLADISFFPQWQPSFRADPENSGHVAAIPASPPGPARAHVCEWAAMNERPLVILIFAIILTGIVLLPFLDLKARYRATFKYTDAQIIKSTLHGFVADRSRF
jgi:hypothetical protein